MRTSRRPRGARLVAVCLSAAVVLPVPGWATPASADEDVTTGDTVSGTFQQVWPEYEDPRTAAEHAGDGPLSYLRTSAGDVVRLDTDDVQDLEVGATVELTVGRTVTDAASAEGYERAREVLDAEVLAPAPAAPPLTSPATPPFTNSVTVAMVVPAGGARDSASLTDVVAAVNGPVADFWERETDGAIRLGVTTSRDWITATAGCSDPYELWDEVAAKVGFTRGSGKHLLLYVPNTGLPACSYGLAEVGSSPSTGGFSYVRDTETSVLAHELGHNFGLGHSSGLLCSGSGYNSGCSVEAYRDYYDVMGASWDQLGSLTVVQAARFMPVSSRSFELTGSTETVTLAPVSGRTGVRGIAMRNSDGRTYWLEYRPSSGRDQYLGTQDNWVGLQSGVLLRQDTEGNDTSLLLDGTPSSPSAWESDFHVALQVGATVRIDDYVTGGAYRVTVQAVTVEAATVRVEPVSAVTLAHEAAGGDAGPMGAPTAAEVCGTAHVTRYCERAYENGGIYWTHSTGAHLVRGEILPFWLAGNGFSGVWGFPSTDTACGLADGGCAQQFQGGAIYWSPGAGTFGTSGQIGEFHRRNGAQAGLLGYPTAPAVCDADGCDQPFEGGTVVWEETRGAIVVQGPFRDAWASAGGRSGWPGPPSAAMRCDLVRGGCSQRFDGGWLYWSAASGVHGVSARIMSAWAAQAWERGSLGYPTADEICGLTGGGCRQSFEGGTVLWSSATGARAVAGPVGETWAAQGAESGVLGYPTGNQTCGLVNGGCLQQFQGGTVYRTTTTGAHAVVTGPVERTWGAQRWEQGPLGYPSSAQVCGLVGGGCLQRFQGGTIYAGSGTVGHVVSGAFAAAWAAEGSDAGPLGPPTGDQRCGLAGGGCLQSFLGGAVYHTAATGARAVHGAVAGAFARQRWEQGPLGYPTSAQVCGLVGGGCLQRFQGGTIYATTATGAHVILGPIGDAWGAQRWEQGPLGYPMGDQRCGLAGGGCLQSFQGGTVYYTAATGARVVTGAVAGAFARQRWEQGPLGYPTSAQVCGLVGGGCLQRFQGGTIYATTATGAHAILGPIGDAWGAQRWEQGPLGYPTGDQRCGLAGGGCLQSFQGGTVYYTAATGARAVAGPVATHWGNQGAESGPLGYPIGGQVCGLKDGGCLQRFQGGTVYGTNTGTATVVPGPIANHWAAQRWEAGPLGFPATDQRCDVAVGGCRQDFRAGSVLWSPSTGAQSVLAGPIADVWAAQGSASGFLGYPTTARSCGLVADGCLQRFQGGTIYSTAVTGTHAVSGPIAAAWGAQRWERGPLGYPTSGPYPVTGGTAQDFQGGTLTLDDGSGQVTRD
ncbi:hypothetical protein [Blastococcus mobilis]|uniref:LGFP repeat-containing protein n=1 Tax=Blastococcus mobilis TaxID=1938746 RepID=A0A238XGJ1_9ACTN|nr:hypothetical protein [Blastococcus mobilis]SNR57039.1 LGFP repeat-containing protein [Blastococcus mobilis]